MTRALSPDASESAHDAVSDGSWVQAEYGAEALGNLVSHWTPGPQNCYKVLYAKSSSKPLANTLILTGVEKSPRPGQGTEASPSAQDAGVLMRQEQFSPLSSTLASGTGPAQNKTLLSAGGPVGSSEKALEAGLESGLCSFLSCVLLHWRRCPGTPEAQPAGTPPRGHHPCEITPPCSSRALTPAHSIPPPKGLPPSQGMLASS